MSEVRFYHLTRAPLENTLPQLLEKSLQRGWRVLLQCGSAQRMAFLDERLWMGQPTSFLPHGTVGADNAADQPILLTESAENLNDANVLMLVEGAKSTPETMGKYELACLFFDGNDPQALDAARNDWKEVAASDLKAVYWAQNDGGQWVKRAESGG